jgi:hypothetical protein
MTKETEQVCKEILAEIANGSRFSEVKNYSELFDGVEKLISNLAWLVSPLLEAEQAYRIKVLSYRKDGESVAGAEMKAKCDPEYLTWQKLRETRDLADAQIKVIKKFASLLQEEYRNV